MWIVKWLFNLSRKQKCSADGESDGGFFFHTWSFTSLLSFVLRSKFKAHALRQLIALEVYVKWIHQRKRKFFLKTTSFNKYTDRKIECDILDLNSKVLNEVF